MKDLYPESIRGGWFLLREDTDIDEALEKQRYEFVFFGIDGTFTRAEFKNGNLQSRETGDYTFDGDFLITRARNTETYRVRAERADIWDAETKKHGYTLLRSLRFASDVPTAELTEQEHRDIRILPIRVVAEPVAEEINGAYRLVFTRGETQEEVLVGMASAEVEPKADEVWVGVMALVEGIEPKTWERIAREVIIEALELEKDVTPRLVFLHQM